MEENVKLKNWLNGYKKAVIYKNRHIHNTYFSIILEIS